MKKGKNAKYYKFCEVFCNDWEKQETIVEYRGPAAQCSHVWFIEITNYCYICKIFIIILSLYRFNTDNLMNEAKFGLNTFRMGR